MFENNDHLNELLWKNLVYEELQILYVCSSNLTPVQTSQPYLSKGIQSDNEFSDLQNQNSYFVFYYIFNSKVPPLRPQHHYFQFFGCGRQVQRSDIVFCNSFEILAPSLFDWSYPSLELYLKFPSPAAKISHFLLTKNFFSDNKHFISSVKECDLSSSINLSFTNYKIISPSVMNIHK